VHNRLVIYGFAVEVPVDANHVQSKIELRMDECAPVKIVPEAAKHVEACEKKNVPHETGICEDTSRRDFFSWAWICPSPSSKR